MGIGAGRTPIGVFVVQSAQKSFETRVGLLRKAHVVAALCDEMAGGLQARKRIDGSAVCEYMRR